ncbi:hypothetical protein CP09DC78_0704B, partial [Chlamydia psittaci 09DC78]
IISNLYVVRRNSPPLLHANIIYELTGALIIRDAEL